MSLPWDDPSHDAAGDLRRAMRRTRIKSWREFQWYELHAVPRVQRQCFQYPRCSRPHSWEWLNPATRQPYRRGRVTFWCALPPLPPGQLAPGRIEDTDVSEDMSQTPEPEHNLESRFCRERIRGVRDGFIPPGWTPGAHCLACWPNPTATASMERRLAGEPQTVVVDGRPEQPVPSREETLAYAFSHLVASRNPADPHHGDSYDLALEELDKLRDRPGVADLIVLAEWAHEQLEAQQSAYEALLRQERQQLTDYHAQVSLLNAELSRARAARQPSTFAVPESTSVTHVGVWSAGGPDLDDLDAMFDAPRQPGDWHYRLRKVGWFYRCDVVSFGLVDLSNVSAHGWTEAQAVRKAKRRALRYLQSGSRGWLPEDDES